MNRKLKNTIVLIALLVFILVGGGVYIFAIQGSKISDKKDKLKELKANGLNKDDLEMQYKSLLVKSAVLDSILASRKFNIPNDLNSIKFFDFVTNVTADFSPRTHVDVEFVESGQDKEFLYYNYKLTGNGTYSDVYKLIYALEQSKELKKLSTVTMSNFISTDDDGLPYFDVSFTLNAKVYYSQDSRFATAQLVENNLNTTELYDAFYPLIRKEIPPNIDQLLDVQNATLLALVPEGAFLSDGKGSTYLLWEGEPVYLGYLTKIDYNHNKVNFILNKGGIIEQVELKLQKEQDIKKQK